MLGDSSPVVVVGGLPRSGTSFWQSLLNAHSEVLIFDEFHAMLDEGFPRFLEGHRRFFDRQFERWRRVSPAEMDARFRELLVQFWALGTNPALLEKAHRRVRVFGLKTPGVERSLTWLSSLFGDRRIVFLYCVRSPLQVLRSLHRMPWGEDATNETLIQDLVRRHGESMGQVEEARELANVKVRLCSVQHAGETEPQRLEYATTLFRALGLEIDEPAHDFVREWRVVDHWPNAQEGRAPGMPKTDFKREELERFQTADTIVRFRREYGIS